MGIPMFFRWISERYPMCSQLITDNSISEFDNLYLDMNGIIHNCSHLNTPNVHHRITEDQIWIGIFNYIDHLFSKIRPKKLLFLAIDGVAPRAKMNQQRSRRFRTAREAENLRQIALERGDKLPEEEAFDSNCITPGTIFMKKLTAQLRYFIAKKVSEDAGWRDIQVVLSGPDVPGEGEHKIMEYIRLSKAQPDYDPNVRHCLYGLDADLIMLGLLSHDPHFALLREEVTFGKPKQTSLPNQNFFLMHLSIMREYLDLEFRPLTESLSFPYDFERVLDDFILLALFVGNDFLPHLPGLHIHEGALGLMFKIYKDVLPTCEGYIQNSGQVNMQRLQKILDGISEVVENTAFEVETMEAEEEDGPSERRLLEKFEQLDLRKKKSGKFVMTDRQQRIFIKVNDALQGGALKGITLNFDTRFRPRDRRFLNTLAEELHMACQYDFDIYDQTTYVELSIDSDLECEDGESDESSEFATRNRVLKKYEEAKIVPEGMSKEEKQEFEANLKQWKTEYYKEKMDIDYNNTRQMDDIVGSYIIGIQWVLKYYYDGVASWNWFYPYHYAPKITDLKDIERVADYQFTLSQPFKPFEQLMGVLPSLSRKLLPTAYQDLMTDPFSPIIDFYPHTFELDKNGKKQEWEAIVRIPFIDEQRLLAAMKTREYRLTREEQQRTQFGNSYVYSYDESLQFIPLHNVPPLRSSLPGIFPDIQHCFAREKPYTLPSGYPLRKLLLPGALTGKDALAGFPSMYTLPFTHEIKHCDVHVFTSDSANESIAITLQNQFENMDICEIAGALLYKIVYINYPFLKEAVVLGVSNSEKKYYAKENNGKRQIFEHTWQDNELVEWKNKISRSEYMDKKRFALDIGHIGMGLHVCAFNRMHQTDDGAIIKEFARIESEEIVPIQTVVTHVAHPDPRFIEKPPPPIRLFLPLNSTVFYLGSMILGQQATVTDHVDNYAVIEFITPVETQEIPEFGREIAAKQDQEVTYKSAHTVTRELKISPFVLSKITSTLLVMDNAAQRVNIGLGLKFDNRGEMTMGYTRKNTFGFWEYSYAAISLIRDYCNQFPEFIQWLDTQKGKGFLSFHDFRWVNDGHTEVYKMRRWIESKGVDSLDRVPLGTVELLPEYCRYVEDCAIAYNESYSNLEVKRVTLAKIPPTVLLRPSDAERRLFYQPFSLGDRVVYVSDSGSVPIGYKGTVVGLGDKVIDVIFDIAFLGGGTLGSRCSPGRGATLPFYSVLNTSGPPRTSTSQSNSNYSQSSSDSQERNSRSPYRARGRGYKNGSARGRGRGGRNGSYTFDPKRNASDF